MDAFLIQGPSPLKGEVEIDGAKNAALPILFASLMVEGEVVLQNIPKVQDVLTTRALFKKLGIPCKSNKKEFVLDPRKLTKVVAPYELVKQMRASILCLGPLLARYGEAKVSFPGGCTIGSRPINWHIDGLTRLGAEITVKDGFVEAKAKKLTGASFRFPKKTVTGTANVLCAAVLASGKTCLSNVAREPEIQDLCHFLVTMGARISGIGTATLEIQGVKHLRSGAYRVMDDRLEWGTFAIAAAATQGDVVIKSHLNGGITRLLIKKLREAGATISVDTANQCTHVTRLGSLKHVNITTRPYPGFPTDLQAPWMALMTQAKGISHIKEHIFENRFMHVAELSRLGAHIDIHGVNEAVVRGAPNTLTGAEIMASDLRASAALVIAALCAKGETRIRRIYHLDRGYQGMETKLQKLGASVKRIEAPI